MPFGTIFRDKLEEISLWSPVRRLQASPETAPFGSQFSESLVQVVSIHSRASSPASGPLVVNYELVRSPEEEFVWQVPRAVCYRALNGDRLELDARGWSTGHFSFPEFSSV